MPCEEGTYQFRSNQVCGEQQLCPSVLSFGDSIQTMKFDNGTMLAKKYMYSALHKMREKLFALGQMADARFLFSVRQSKLDG